MFGSSARRKAPFDFSPETYGTPGIGDGLPGATPMGDPGLGFGAPLAQPARPASKFGVRDVIGIIGEALGGAAGNGPGAYTQMKLREREISRQQQMAQMARQQGMSDWLAKEKYKDANPDRSEFERRLIAGGTQPGTPEWVAANKAAALNTYDPIINASVGGRDFFGPRSLLQSEIVKGGDPSSQVSGAAAPPSPAASSSGGPFMSVGQYKAMRESMGAGYDGWSKKYGVPVQVTSPEEMAALPAGTPVVSPDGRRGVKK